MNVEVDVISIHAIVAASDSFDESFNDVLAEY